MGIREIAAAAVDLLSAQREEEFMQTYFAEDVTSIEAFDFGFGREVQGKEDAIKRRLAAKESFNLHSMEVERPFFNGEYKFGLIMKADATDKMMGGREQITFLSIFTVRDDKIVLEETFM